METSFKKVLFSGIDGAGKTSCLNALILRLAPTHRILRIGTTGFEVYNLGNYQHRINSNRMEQVGSRVRGGPFYGLWLICNHLYKFFFAKYFLLFEKYDLVFYETDAIINPTVYLAYHFPRLCRFFNAKLRFGLVNFFFGTSSHTMIFYLEVEPHISVERCINRDLQGDQEIEPHQNLETMEMLREEFRKVTQAAIEKGYDLLAIDTTDLTLDQVAETVENFLLKRI